jgi:hypothetical protein
MVGFRRRWSTLELASFFLSHPSSIFSFIARNRNDVLPQESRLD